MASDSYHEPFELIAPEVRERHRAIVSLMEELEAVDWYDQRVSASQDPELRAILAHNRDEEKEHAAMVIEWLRRNDPKFASYLDEFVYTDGPIVSDHGHDDGDHGNPAAAAAPSADGSLGIGSLRRPVPERR